jgi:uncharacterized protein YoxC
VSEETLAQGFNDVAVWEIALLIIAVPFAFLCIWLTVRVVNKLGGTINRVNRTLDDLELRTGPMLDNLNTTVDNVNATLKQVEGELEKVGGITNNAAHISSNVANITSLVASAVGSPLVKLAALGFGVRSAVKKRSQAVDEDQVRRMVEAAKQTRKERKRARKTRRGRG